ncbi:MAG: hypothetical protein ACE14M_03390 [Terriglobales bacterium]
MSNVLCVAGRPQELEWYQNLLQQLGHTVTAVNSLSEALDALRLGQHYDLLVTAWIIGSETAGALVATAKQTGAIPVMVVSSLVERAFQEAGASVDLYLAKPTTAGDFVQLADILLTSAAAKASEPEESKSKVAAAPSS